MDYIWDTNILLHQVRQTSHFDEWSQKYSLFDPNNRSFISIVSVGEIYSLAKRRNWGKHKLERLRTYLNQITPLPIANRSIIDAYATIDTYSQGKLSNHPLPNNLTARNMGKNDLWIAATSHVTQATLLTTDKDFEHLDKTYLNLISIS